MKNIIKKGIMFLMLLCLCLMNFVYAHSGNTDASGGHRDNKNVSGLGYYHYHHGYGPHLHPNGVCPYSKKRVKKATIKISKKSLAIYKGKTYTLKITGTKKKVTWTSNNKGVATVNSKGKITAKKAGTATITAKVNGKKHKCKLTVKTPQ